MKRATLARCKVCRTAVVFHASDGMTWDDHDGTIRPRDEDESAPTCRAVRMANLTAGLQAVECGGELEYVSEVGDG